MTDPIRILHVIGIMNRGGAETMIMNLYRNIDRSRIQFDFVENTDAPAAFDEEIRSLGGKIFRCPHYNGKNHFAYTKWWNQFFAEHAKEYPIVHGHLGSTAAIYLKIAKKHGLYTIAHSHNTRTQINLNEILYAIYAYPTRFIADHFFACGRSAGISRYGKRIGLNPSKCVVLANAIDLCKFSFNVESREAMRKKLGIQHQTVLGHIGRFSSQKNHSFLIDIFDEIHRLNKDTVLLLVGGGDLQQEIEYKVQRLWLSEAVIFAGVQSNVSDYYQAMDVMVFPSLYEGLPVTMVEAQATGLPCVISDFVPKECILTSGLVTSKSLSDSAEEWARHSLAVAQIERTSRHDELRQRGYDIQQTAKWLGEFYETHAH